MCETDVITSYTTKTVDNDSPSTEWGAIMMPDPIVLPPFTIHTRNADGHSQIAVCNSGQPTMDGKATHALSFAEG